jgi:hypothetical protein
MIKNIYLFACKVTTTIFADFGETRFFSKYFRKKNSKFHENLSSKSPVVPCGQKDGRTYRHTKLTVAFHNSVQMIKKNLKHFHFSNCVLS